MRKKDVSKKTGNSDPNNIGSYSGANGVYAGLEFKAESKILGTDEGSQSHIKEHDKADYLDYIKVTIKPQNSKSRKANLFKINSCEDGKVLELHVATGDQLNSIQYTNEYASTKELCLHGEETDDSREIQIRYVVYNYTEGNERDLEEFECKSGTGKDIEVYNKIEGQESIAKILAEVQGDGGIPHTPDTQGGSILVGRRP